MGVGHKELAPSAPVPLSSQLFLGDLVTAQERALCSLHSPTLLFFISQVNTFYQLSPKNSAYSSRHMLQYGIAVHDRFSM